MGSLGPGPPCQIPWRRSLLPTLFNSASSILGLTDSPRNCVPGQKRAPLLITWVREAKPRGLAQDIAFGVGAGQVTVGRGGRREGIGDREHEAEEPGDAER